MALGEGKRSCVNLHGGRCPAPLPQYNTCASMAAQGYPGRLFRWILCPGRLAYLYTQPPARGRRRDFQTGGVVLQGGTRVSGSRRFTPCSGVQSCGPKFWKT